MNLRTYALLLVAVGLVGCWPARYAYRTGLGGTVISADDSSPIAGATIRMTVPSFVSVPPLSVVTSADGRFEVQPYYEWHMTSVMGESWPLQGSIEIVASGFVSFRKELEWPQTGPKTNDLGVVRLVRKN